MHELLEALQAEELTRLYLDLNPVVHGGMPHVALGLSSGDAADADSTEWLRPLRALSPWSFRPLLATGVALNVATLHVMRFFIPLMPELLVRAAELAREHQRVCARAELPHLAFKL